MMVMLPLRSVLAFDQTTCQMQGEASQEMVDHSMHMMFEVAQVDTNEIHNCCSDSGMTCSNNDCGMGMSVSFIMESANPVPALTKTSLRTHVNNILVLRELTPPTRPPAYL